LEEAVAVVASAEHFRRESALAESVANFLTTAPHCMRVIIRLTFCFIFERE
jgi:hypothetical protein